MDVNKLSYEEAVKELEDIINFLEKDDYSLSDAMAKFKSGVEIYKYCNDLLAKAEGEIKILLGDEEQTFEDLNLFREVDGYY